MKSISEIITLYNNAEHKRDVNYDPMDYYVGELIDYVAENFEFHPEQATKIVGFAYETHHGYGFEEVAYQCDSLATKIMAVMRTPIPFNERPSWQHV